jgi:hypothetical protein
MAQHPKLNLIVSAKEQLKELIRSGQIFYGRPQPHRTQRKVQRVAPFRTEQVEIYEEDSTSGHIGRDHLL